MTEKPRESLIYRLALDHPLARLLHEANGEPVVLHAGNDRYRIERELAPDGDVRRAWEIINALRTENAAHDPDAVFADVTEAVAEVRRKTDGT